MSKWDSMIPSSSCMGVIPQQSSSQPERLKHLPRSGVSLSNCVNPASVGSCLPSLREESRLDYAPPTLQPLPALFNLTQNKRCSPSLSECLAVKRREGDLRGEAKKNWRSQDLGCCWLNNFLGMLEPQESIYLETIWLSSSDLLDSVWGNRSSTQPRLEGGPHPPSPSNTWKYRSIFQLCLPCLPL